MKKKKRIVRKPSPKLEYGDPLAPLPFVGGGNPMQMPQLQAPAMNFSNIANQATNTTSAALNVAGGAAGGAGALGALGGVGAALGPIGAAAGLVGSIVGGIGQRAQMKRQQAAAKRQYNKAQEQISLNKSKEVYSQYPTNGISGSQSFAMGGNINGMNIDPSNVQQISNDMFKFQGPSHANGGIPIDTDNDMMEDAEVEGGETLKGDRVYSDRFSPSKEGIDRIKSTTGVNVGSGTYADISKRLGSKLKEAEDNDSQRRQTTKEFTNRNVNEALDILFKDQQMSKMGNGLPNPMMMRGGILNKFSSGGEIPTVSKKDIPTYIAKGYYTSNEAPTDRTDYYNVANDDPNDTASYYLIPQYPPKPAVPTGGVDYIPNFYAGQSNMYTRTLNGQPLPAQQPPIQASAIAQNAYGGTLKKLAFGDTLKKANEALGSPAVGQGLNFVNYLNNRATLKNVPTTQKAIMQRTGPFVFNNAQFNNARNQSGVDYHNTLKNIQRSTSQDPSQAMARMIANKYQANNQIAAAEQGARADAYNQYGQRVDAVNAGNIQNSMQTQAANMARQRQLSIDKNNANRAFFQGVMGNAQTAQANQIEKDKIFLTALQQGDRGTMYRALQGMPDMVRRYNIDLEGLNPNKEKVSPVASPLSSNFMQIPQPQLNYTQQPMMYRSPYNSANNAYGGILQREPMTKMKRKRVVRK